MIRRNAQCTRRGKSHSRLALGSPYRLKAYGLTLWLRPDPARITLNAGDVSAWLDGSGNGRDVSQGTGANQPLYVAGAVNGKPCVRFTAANSDNLVRTNTNLFSAGPYTIYMTLKMNSSGALSYFANDTNPSTTGIILSNTGGRNLFHTGIFGHADGAVQTSTPEIWGGRYQAGSGPVFELNGVVTAVTNPSGSGLTSPGGTAAVTIGARAIGTADFSDVDMYEFTAFTTFVTDSANARITGYCRARMAL